VLLEAEVASPFLVFLKGKAEGVKNQKTKISEWSDIQCIDAEGEERGI
jgi:hypothetical protein